MEIFVCLLQTEDRNGKLQFVCCKQKRKTEVLFLGRQMTNSSRRLLFQQMYPSMVKGVKSLFVVERF